MVTFSCQLMKTGKCDQTLAFVSAAKTGINKRMDSVCFKLPHAIINSISYDLHHKKYKVAYLSEHTWYTTFRRLSVLVWRGLSSPLDLY